MSGIIIETILNSLFPSVWQARWVSWRQRRWKRAMKRRNAEKTLRDYVAQSEINAMRQIINEATEQASRGAILSTSRQAAKIGLSNDAALVILQWLLMSRP